MSWRRLGRDNVRRLEQGKEACNYWSSSRFSPPRKKRKKTTPHGGKGDEGGGGGEEGTGRETDRRRSKTASDAIDLHFVSRERTNSDKLPNLLDDEQSSYRIANARGRIIIRKNSSRRSFGDLEIINNSPSPLRDC